MAEKTYMAPFDFPCYYPKSYLELPSPPKPSGVLVSVCASTWNRPKWIITSSIASLFNQKFPPENYEVILVDDATDGPNREELLQAIHELIRDYPNHNFRAYLLEHTRCWNDSHVLNVAFKRSLGWILIQSQTDLLHDGETLESAWRHHNNDHHIRLNPEHHGIYLDGHIEPTEWYRGEPHEMGASYLKEHVVKVKGRNETVWTEPSDVDFQSAMRDHSQLIVRKDPAVRTLHRPIHPVCTGPNGRRVGATYPDAVHRGRDGAWTEGDWGLLTESEEKRVEMTEAMKKMVGSDTIGNLESNPPVD